MIAWCDRAAGAAWWRCWRWLRTVPNLALTVARRPDAVGVDRRRSGMTLALGALAPLQSRMTAMQTPEAFNVRVKSRLPRRGAATLTLDSRSTACCPRCGGPADTATAETPARQFSNRPYRAWSTWAEVMPQGVDRGLLLAWAVASVLVLALFVAVHVRYQRRRARWPQEVVQGTTVRVAADTGPAVIGVTRTDIVVPAWLLERDAKEQALVLAHELEHVRARDPLLLAVAQAAVVLLPWHPAVWWMASRMKLAVELDCDRRVLQRGASARDYGTLLIDLTDHRAGFGAALPAFSCSPSHLERRLVAMTPKRLKYPLVRSLTAGAFASLALLAACEAKLPTSEEVDAMTAKSATAAAAQVTMLDTANVRYFIDDVPATKAQAEKLSAEQIATVNVLQKGTQSGGEVRIVTVPHAAGYAKDSANPTRITYTRSDSAKPTGVIMLRKPGSTDMMFTTTADSVAMIADSVVIRPRTGDASKPRTPFTGLLIVDGVARESNSMNSISPDRIESVNVMKGPAATAKYSDPRAANGVIEIVTKKAATP